MHCAWVLAIEDLTVIREEGLRKMLGPEERTLTNVSARAQTRATRHNAQSQGTLRSDRVGDIAVMETSACSLGTSDEEFGCLRDPFQNGDGGNTRLMIVVQDQHRRNARLRSYTPTGCFDPTGTDVSQR